MENLEADMADGGARDRLETVFDTMRLARATAPRSSLWARCACGREAIVDPTPWIAQGLARQQVHDLEGRLRCVCGARQAELEIRGLAEAPRTGTAGGIFIFR